jgi:5-methylcytosine-specific restriction protein A
MPIRPPVFRPAWQPSEAQRKAEYARRRQVRDPWRAWFGTARWKQRRADQLTREPLCVRCLAAGRRTPATVANHKTPHRGDAIKFWTGALESVCASCHSRLIQIEENRSRGGY